MLPVVLVTGGGSGIGRATILKFAGEGYHCVIADINIDNAKETAAMVKAVKPEVKTLVIQVDVTKSDDVQRMVNQTVEEFTRIDVAVNCAGIYLPQSGGPLHQVPDEAWMKTIDVNLTGVFLCMKYEIAQMLKQESLHTSDPIRSKIKGSIVNASSVAGKVACPNMSAYSSSKFGVSCLTQSVQKEYAESGIRINAVCPGFIDTPMVGWAKRDVSASQKLLSSVYPDRLGTSEEIADSIYFLGSLSVPFIKGALLSIDGGGVKV